MKGQVLKCDKCDNRSVLYGPVGLGEEHAGCGGFYRLEEFDPNRVAGANVLNAMRKQPFKYAHPELLNLMADPETIPFMAELRAGEVIENHEVTPLPWWTALCRVFGVPIQLRLDFTLTANKSYISHGGHPTTRFSYDLKLCVGRFKHLEVPERFGE